MSSDPMSRRTRPKPPSRDRKSTRLNSSHDQISYAVFCLKKKNKPHRRLRARSKSERHGRQLDLRQCAAAHFGEIVHEARAQALPFFFFNDTATTEIYTLSLHDALPHSQQ